jgi:DNA polymerase
MTNQQKLEKVADEIAKCQRCPLYKTAKNPVAGEGNSEAELLFIGEAPGFYEDQKGRPFVGNAGQFLNELLESISLAREKVFITNILKHRPPNNRDPQEPEIDACNLWLDYQLKIIKPKIIATLGRFSMSKFLPKFSISRVHGKLFNVDGLSIFPLFHPAAALRSSQVEVLLREDFKKIPSLLLYPSGDGSEDNGGNRNSKQLNLL